MAYSHEDLHATFKYYTPDDFTTLLGMVEDRLLNTENFVLSEPLIQKIIRLSLGDDGYNEAQFSLEEIASLRNFLCSKEYPLLAAKLYPGASSASTAISLPEVPAVVALERGFESLIASLPEGYWDRFALMHLMKSLFKQLRLPTEFTNGDEIMHLAVQLLMSFLKVNVWMGAAQYFADTENGQSKVAAAFAGFIGLLPQLLSLIQLKISLPQKMNVAHWLQRTLATGGMAFLVPLTYFQDLSSQQSSTDAGAALYQAVRIAATIIVVEGVVPRGLYDATEVLRRSYINIKEQWQQRRKRIHSARLAGGDSEPLLDDASNSSFSTRVLAQLGKDLPTNYTPAQQRIMRILNEYHNVPYLFLFLLVAYFVFIALYESEGTKRCLASEFAYGNLAAFLSFVIAAILSKIHAYLNRY